MSIPSASDFSMWVISVLSVACLLVSPSHAEIKELSTHFADPVEIEDIPLEFHKENTVTNDLVFDDFEDEDYIDFDKILAAGDDDYT